MNVRNTSSRRIAVALGLSAALGALVWWWPHISSPHISSPHISSPRIESLPPAPNAKPEALPALPAKPLLNDKPEAPKSAPAPAPAPVPAPALRPASTERVVPLAASAPVAASAADSVAVAAPASERAPLHAQLTFAINKGTSNFRIGEAIHTLDIKDGRYALKATTTTVGLARLLKKYELDQYSNGSYSKNGLQPERFTEERIDTDETRRNSVELDRGTQRARFSDGSKMPLPPATQDILSVLYQLPPLSDTEIATVSVCNGRKIERYQFEVTADQMIDTPMGKLLTVRLHKRHAPDEEGLDIWLAQKYRLFPVKMRFIEKNGDITGEAVITDIHISEEQGATSNAVN